MNYMQSGASMPYSYWSLDPIPLSLYVHIQDTRDLVYKSGCIEGYSVETVARGGTYAFKCLMYRWKLGSKMY